MSRAPRIFSIGTRSMIFGIPILPLGAISIYYIPAINRISSRYGRVPRRLRSIFLSVPIDFLASLSNSCSPNSFGHPPHKANTVYDFRCRP